MNRPSKNLKQRSRVLIVTNGQQEQLYFSNLTSSFKSQYEIEVIFKKGNALSLVELAIEKSEELLYNQAWCVFDIDEEYNDGNLVLALNLANANRIGVAYSNEAFEIWLMYHYEKTIARVKRSQYDRIMLELIQKYKLSKVKKYAKLDEELLRKRFIPFALIATQNAKIAYQLREREHLLECGNKSNYPIWDWLSTSSVFKLIERLRLTKR